MLITAVAIVAASVATLAGVRALLHAGIRAALAAPRVGHDRTPAMLGLPFETVRIPTANRRTLHAWLIPPPAAEGAPSPAVVIVHGWGGNAAAMLPLAGPLHRAGLATLFVDARCHGASDADSFASLPRFAEDVEHGLQWLAAQPSIDPARIALLGHSVGAGAVLLAASRRSDVAAVVSVAAFSHPAAMMRRWLRAKRIPERPLGRYILAYVQKSIGFAFDDIAPVRSIARVRCPVLLVHGQHDDVVPLSDGEELFAARSGDRVELLVLAGDHASFADLARHLARVTDFLQSALSSGSRQPAAAHAGEQHPGLCCGA